jgi:hypothetical protein
VIEIVFLMLLVDLLNAADRQAFLACGFDDLVEKIANYLVTVGAYPHPLASPHKSADHAGTSERLSCTWRPLNRKDALVQRKCDPGGGPQRILALNLQALSPQPRSGRNEKIARRTVFAGPIHPVFRNVLSQSIESLGTLVAILSSSRMQAGLG